MEKLGQSKFCRTQISENHFQEEGHFYRETVNQKGRRARHATGEVAVQDTINEIRILKSEEVDCQGVYGRDVHLIQEGQLAECRSA